MSAVSPTSMTLARPTPSVDISRAGPGGASQSAFMPATTLLSLMQLALGTGEQPADTGIRARQPASSDTSERLAQDVMDGADALAGRYDGSIGALALRTARDAVSAALQVLRQVTSFSMMGGNMGMGMGMGMA